ncbi:hypothetical protein DYB34_011317 [Aphanomyces astaci]|uniref:Chromo domain-containing protein n=1 Tax=Aphanomyces astaci TaxID=112090 RepID=A0A418BDQ3_APHAT|nr:hypothetical protein DYB34_011317 [Aphanomyces astaci]
MDDEESSWEPAANLLDDIPIVFRKWAAANKEDPAVAALIKTLDLRRRGSICYLDEGSVAESREEAGDKTLHEQVTANLLRLAVLTKSAKPEVSAATLECLQTWHLMSMYHTF